MPGRRLLAAALVVAAAAYGLTRLDTYVRTPVGAAGVGGGPFPVVMVAGLGSTGGTFADLASELGEQGTTVLDFDAGRDGVQPLLYEPRDGDDGIAEVAVEVVLPAIRGALERAGLDPDAQRVDVVAHSTGGLLVRYLVERPVEGWDGRVDDLVMVAVPNRGSTLVWLETRGGRASGMGSDMRPGSAFLRDLGYDEPPGQTYTTIGGDPWLFRVLAPGGLGFDDQVPARSPFLDGAANNTYPELHGDLLPDDDVVDLIVATLGAGG